MTQHKARRTNQIAFFSLPWAQEAPGSNPGAPTILFPIFNLLFERSEFPTAGPNVRYGLTYLLEYPLRALVGLYRETFTIFSVYQGWDSVRNGNQCCEP